MACDLGVKSQNEDNILTGIDANTIIFCVILGVTGEEHFGNARVFLHSHFIEFYQINQQCIRLDRSYETGV